MPNVSLSHRAFLSLRRTTTNRPASLFRLAAWIIGLAVLAQHPAQTAPAANPGAPNPNLMLWLKAEDLGKALQDGQPVVAWPDASGRRNHAVANEGMRPTFEARGAAGRPAVEFAGDVKATPKVVQRLQLPLKGEWRGATIFVVGTNLHDATWFSTGNTPGAFRLLGVAQHTNNPKSPSTKMNLAATAGAQMVTLVDRLDADGVLRLDIYGNGRRTAGFETDEAVMGLIWKEGTLGAWNETMVHNGEIAEFLVYQGALSEADRKTVEAYLAAKYGIAPPANAPTQPVGFPVDLQRPPAPAPVKTAPVTPGLRLWARADDLKLESGDRVSEVPNAAGDKRPLTGEGDARPYFVEHGLNGRPEIEFRGVRADANAKPPREQQENLLRLPLQGEVKELTVMLVGRKLQDHGVLDLGSGATGFRASGGFRHAAFPEAANAPLLRYISQGQLLTLTLKFDGRGGHIASYANGVLQEQMTATAVPARQALIAIKDAALGRVANSWAGALSEVLIYDRALPAAERQATEKYLAEKYALVMPTPQQAARARSTYSLTHPHLAATQEWLHQPFTGKTEWMQTGAFEMVALPDGTVIACSVWDEAHKEIGWYKNGRALGGYSGGTAALATDGEFLYLGVSGAGRGTPRSGLKRWALRPGVAGAEPVKRLPALQVKAETWPRPYAAEVPWPGQKAGEPIWWDVPKHWDEVRGIAVSDDTIYVVVQNVLELKLLDKKTGATRRTVPLDGAPGKLALSKDGTLWVVAGDEVVQFTAAGERTGKKVVGLKPGGVILDGRGRLLVSDLGERHQIVIFDVSGPQPKEVSALGERGGVYAGPLVGQMGENRLYRPKDLDVDAAGNIYVMGSDSLLRCYSPDWKLRWQLEATSFTTVGDFDPAGDGNEVYTDKVRYTRVGNSVAQNSEGRLTTPWQWTGVTNDLSRWPTSPGNGQYSVLRRINGRLYRFLVKRMLEIQVQEPNSNVFRPVALYAKDDGDKTVRPAGAPEKGRFAWSDRNDNGKIDPDEITVPSEQALRTQPTYDIFVDFRGDIWVPQRRYGVRRLKVQGFSPGGAPLYDMSTEEQFKRPSEFVEIERVHYFPETDTIYFSGNTWENQPNGNEEWGNVGREAIRYDNWSQPTRHLTSRMVYPRRAWTPRAMHVLHDADRLFMGEMGQNVIFVYDTKTGAELGIVEIDPELYGPNAGWIDQSGGVRAFKRQNGEVLVLSEDCMYGRGFLFRLPPGTPLAPDTTPAVAPVTPIAQ